MVLVLMWKGHTHTHTPSALCFVFFRWLFAGLKKTPIPSLLIFSLSGEMKLTSRSNTTTQSSINFCCPPLHSIQSRFICMRGILQQSFTLSKDPLSTSRSAVMTSATVTESPSNAPEYITPGKKSLFGFVKMQVISKREVNLLFTAHLTVI